MLSFPKAAAPHQEYDDRISLNHGASTTLDEALPFLLIIINGVDKALKYKRDDQIALNHGDSTTIDDVF